MAALGSVSRMNQSTPVGDLLRHEEKEEEEEEEEKKVEDDDN